MTYKKDGLGFAETMQAMIYFPKIYETISTSEMDDNEKIVVYQKTIDLYNLGLIEATQ